jgi:hypothetical protein
MIAPETLVKPNRAEEEVRALRGQLAALQRAYDISEEVVRGLSSEIAHIREAGKALAIKYSRACNELSALKAKL